MKLFVALCSFVVAAGCAGPATSPTSSASALQAEAKVSRLDAETTALAAVPGGVIKEAELERENGMLVWSFDVSTPGSKDITEVQVDALNGKVVSVEKETPSDQAEELRHDKKKK